MASELRPGTSLGVQMSVPGKVVIGDKFQAPGPQNIPSVDLECSHP